MSAGGEALPKGQLAQAEGSSEGLRQLPREEAYATNLAWKAPYYCCSSSPKAPPKAGSPWKRRGPAPETVQSEGEKGEARRPTALRDKAEGGSPEWERQGPILRSIPANRERAASCHGGGGSRGGLLKGGGISASKSNGTPVPALDERMCKPR